LFAKTKSPDIIQLILDNEALPAYKKEKIINSLKQNK
jgi:hypothetical protein